MRRELEPHLSRRMSLVAVSDVSDSLKMLLTSSFIAASPARIGFRFQRSFESKSLLRSQMSFAGEVPQGKTPVEAPLSIPCLGRLGVGCGLRCCGPNGSC